MEPGNVARVVKDEERMSVKAETRSVAMIRRELSDVLRMRE